MTQKLLQQGYTMTEIDGVVLYENGNNHVEIYDGEATFYQENKIVKSMEI